MKIQAIFFLVKKNSELAYKVYIDSRTEFISV